MLFLTTNTKVGPTPMYLCKICNHYMQITISPHLVLGKNSQIPHFGEIIGNLALFMKYIGMYHFFGTRVSQTRVRRGFATVAQAELDCGIKKCQMVLEFLGLEYYVRSAQGP